MFSGYYQIIHDDPPTRRHANHRPKNGGLARLPDDQAIDPPGHFPVRLPQRRDIQQLQVIAGHLLGGMPHRLTDQRDGNILPQGLGGPGVADHVRADPPLELDAVAHRPERLVVAREVRLIVAIGPLLAQEGKNEIAVALVFPHEPPHARRDQHPDLRPRLPPVIDQLIPPDVLFPERHQVDQGHPLRQEAERSYAEDAHAISPHLYEWNGKRFERFEK